MNDILTHYFDTTDTGEVKVLKTAQLAPDYKLHLCRFRSSLYVVVETDYLSGMPSIVKDTEAAFGVIVEGWCVLLSAQPESSLKTLPSDSDDADSDGTNEQNWRNYKDAVLTMDGMSYGVLRVRKPAREKTVH